MKYITIFILFHIFPLYPHYPFTFFIGGIMFKFPAVLLAPFFFSTFLGVAFAQTDSGTIVEPPNALVQGGDTVPQIIKPQIAKPISKIEKSLDSSYAIFKAQVLGDLPENATNGLVISTVNITVQKIISVVDTNTQAASTKDSIFTLYSRSKSNTVYTKNGLRKIETITVTGRSYKTPPAKTDTLNRGKK